MHDEYVPLQIGHAVNTHTWRTGHIHCYSSRQSQIEPKALLEWACRITHMKQLDNAFIYSEDNARLLLHKHNENLQFRPANMHTHKINWIHIYRQESTEIAV